MYWIVVEDDPKPDLYIQILVRPTVKVLELDGKFNKVKIFDNEEGALKYAETLKDAFNVKAVRLFYPEGISRKLS